MSEARLNQLEALVERMSRELDELREREAARQPKRENDAADLFPGRWRKSWSGPSGEGSEEFVVEGVLLRIKRTTAAMKTSFRLELISSEGDAYVLRQTHKSKLPCYPTCDITIRGSVEGYVGSELVNGENVAVTYEPIISSEATSSAEQRPGNAPR